jgi:hypothetical protein
MELDRKKIIELMRNMYNYSYSNFARDLGVDISHLHRFLNTGIGGGKKIYTAFMAFCKAKGLKFEDFLE